MLKSIESTSSLIRVPVYIKQIKRDIRKLIKIDENITDEDLAEKLNVSVSQIGYALKTLNQVINDTDFIRKCENPIDFENFDSREDALKKLLNNMPDTWKVGMHKRLD
jgi:DNA-directed RNA polymerase sigma subunit (sigma70/sigma32)